MGLFRDIIGLATSNDAKSIINTFDEYTRQGPIRSISSMSSRSIFYFPMFVTDDHSVEEIEMFQKYAESNYAVMLAECFAQVPAIKVKAGDMDQISSFLSRFHQNIGATSGGSAAAARKFVSAVSGISKAGSALFTESVSAVPYSDEYLENARNFIVEQWEKYKEYDNAPTRHLDESNYVSVNDIYNESALDPANAAMVERATKHAHEMDLWGFIGESVPDDMFGYDMAFDNEDIPLAGPQSKEPELPAELSDLDEGFSIKGAAKAIGKSVKTVADNISSGSLHAKIAKFPEDTQIRLMADARAKISNIVEKSKLDGIKISNAGRKLFIYDPEIYGEDGSKHKEDLQALLDSVKDIITDFEWKPNSHSIMAVGTTPDIARKYGWRGNSRKSTEAVIDETTTKEAYSILSEKLDAIPNNKIRSAKNRQALNKLESKLNGMKKKYTKYLIRYKKRYEKEEESGKKFKIRFEGHDIDDPKQFMKVYGEFIKVVNKKLALIEARRKEISKSSAKAMSETGHLPEWLDAPLEACSITDLDEMCMNTADMVDEYINEMVSLPDSMTFIYEAGEDKIPEDVQVTRRDRTSDNRPTRFSPIVNTGSMFTDSDIKKANDALPTIIMVNVKMEIESGNGSGNVVDYSFPVGVKVHIHTVPWKELADDISNSLVKNRKLLAFAKFTSGEESSISDFLFGLNSLRKEAKDARSGNSYRVYRSALQRRKRLSKMTLPFIKRNYTLNGSLLISANCVAAIKDMTSLDITDPRTARKLLYEEFLFAIFVSNSADESCKIFYDNDLGFNEVNYKMLQRQQRNNDAQTKDMLRIIASMQR